jgi:hypothetical protein
LASNSKKESAVKRWIVRTNCEYSIVVDDVETADEAMKKAARIELSEWTEAWAEHEAEEWFE